MRRFAKAQEGSEEALKRQAEILKLTARLEAMNSFIVNFDALAKELILERDSATEYEQDTFGQEIPKEDQPNKDKREELQGLIHSLGNKKKKILFEIGELVGLPTP